MKGKINIWLYALTGAVIIIAGAIVSGCINYDNIHIEGYISILATLIGILVTFVIAYQIINTIELKNEQHLIRIQQKEADSKLEEVKQYAEKSEKVWELLKKRGQILDDSNNVTNAVLLQLDCIKLYIDLKWKEEDNYGIETLKSYIMCVYESSFSEKGILYNLEDICTKVDAFKENYQPKIKAVERAAGESSLIMQIKQISLLGECLEIILEKQIKKRIDYGSPKYDDIAKELEELFERYSNIT